MPLVEAIILQTALRDFEALLCLHRRGQPLDLVILGDWNLTFGSEPSLSIGSLHAEPEAACSWLPREMLDRLDLFL